MLKYVIIGYDSDKIEIVYENIDVVNVSKIYLLGNEDIEYTEDNESVNKFEAVYDKNLLTFYEKSNFEKDDDEIIFIDCRDGMKTYFDTLYSMNTSRFKNRSYYIFPKTKVSKNVLNLNDFPFRENFNPWTGETLPSSLTNEERDCIMSMFLDAIMIIKSYLKAEFHLKKMSSIPQNWMLNLSTPVLQHICIYYGLEPHAVDVPRILDYVHNSQYRQIVCKTLIHITSNFLINNQIVNYNPKSNNNDKEKMWFNISTWESLEF